jgi:DNA-binding GntR family transcriptional regulator
MTSVPSADILNGLDAVLFDLLRPARASGIPTALDHAYEMIWRQLMRQERRPGERLADTELAAQLGLSRTPVRQALHLLAQQELVRFDARRGFSVRIFSSRDVREIYDVRGVLEALALRQAAHHLTAQDLDTQRRELADARDALRPGDRSAVILHLQADLKFHNMLIQASGNGRLIRMLAELRSQHMLFQYWDTSYPERNEAAAVEHDRVLAALMAGDVAGAEASMADHIVNARDRVLTDLFREETS